jgi:hypothetical protein
MHLDVARRTLLASASLLAELLPAGCTSDLGALPCFVCITDAQLTGLAVADTTLRVGDIAILRVAPLYAPGLLTYPSTTSATWSVTDSAVVTLEAIGPPPADSAQVGRVRLVARRIGITVVRARMAGFVDSAMVRVTAAEADGAPL